VLQPTASPRAPLLYILAVDERSLQGDVTQTSDFFFLNPQKAHL
jgi:hypothetical protein